ncbi:MAG: hypothetical protein ACM3JF_00110, partial [Sphaerimonospora mesophila]
TAGNAEGLDDEAMAVNADGEQATYFMNNITNTPLNTWDFDNIWVTNVSTPPTFSPVTSTSDGDDNDDNVPDSEQPNVASFINSVNGKRVVVELSDTCSITEASTAAESTAKADLNYIYVNGLVSFAADCTTDSTTVTLYQYGISADGVVARKFNPSSGYFTIDSAVISTVSLNGQSAVRAVYTVEDNGELDLDPLPGKISDPVGLGRFVVGTPSTGI